MQPRTLLILLLFAAGLGGFIFFYEKDLPSTDERRELEKKVLTLEADEVTGLILEWDGQRVRLERPPAAADSDPDDVDTTPRPREWRLTEPLAARADGAQVDGLLSRITDLEKVRELEEIDRAEAGLEDPRARVTLSAAGGDTVLELGAEVPASSDLVLAVAGRATAYQVASDLLADLTRDPGEWRDKKLFTGTRADVDRLTLTMGESQVLLARRGEDFWIESPLADRADSELVNSLMSELTGLTVTTFLDAAPLAPEALGLAPAAGRLEAVLEGREQPFRIELGNPKSDAEGVVYGRADGQLFELATSLPDTLAKSPAEWRSRDWTTLQVFSIEGASFEDAAGTVELTREGADWLRGAERIDYSTASDVLYALADAAAEQVMERAEAAALGHDLSRPELTVHLTTKDSGQELMLYPAAGDLVAATSNDREAVLLLAAGTVEEIRREIGELREAEPLPEEESAEEEG